MTTPTPRSGIPDAWRATLAQKVRAAVHFNNKVSFRNALISQLETPQQDRNVPTPYKSPCQCSTRRIGQGS